MSRYACVDSEIEGGLHRPSIPARGARHATCRWCHMPITRAHALSTWWWLRYETITIEGGPKSGDVLPARDAARWIAGNDSPPGYVLTHTGDNQPSRVQYSKSLAKLTRNADRLATASTGARPSNPRKELPKGGPHGER